MTATTATETVPGSSAVRLRSESGRLVGAVFVAWAAITLGLQALLGEQQESGLVEIASSSPLIAVYLATAFIAGVAWLRGWLPELDLGRPRAWWPYALPFVVAAVPLVLALGTRIPDGLGIILVNVTFVGISEELAFRGMLDRWLRVRLGPVRGVVAVAVVFGLVHALNGIVTGDVAAAAGQAVFNVFAGFWYGTVRVRGGALVPLMAIHALWDAAAISAATVGGTAATVGIAGGLLLIVYGLILFAGIVRRPALAAIGS